MRFGYLGDGTAAPPRSLCYKAHAFLGAGATVRQTQRKQLAVTADTPRVRAMVVGTAVAAAASFGVGTIWALVPGTVALSATAWVLLGVVALALVPLTTPLHQRGHRPLAVRALIVPIAYVAMHELIGRLVPHAKTTPAVLVVFTAVGFAALFVAQAAFVVAPRSRLAQRMRPWIYGGLFLDEFFTRLAFKAWPPPAVTPRHTLLPQRSVVTDAPIVSIVMTESVVPTSPAEPAVAASH